MQQQVSQQASQFMDIYRTGLRTATDIMKASLENAERLQQQQFQAMRSVLEENAKTANQLAEIRSMDEWVALQSSLAGSQMERLVDFWGSMWRAAGDSQSMIRQMQSGEKPAEKRGERQFEVQREQNQPHAQRKTA